MAGFALKRLMAEYKQLNSNPPEGIVAHPTTDENFFEWSCLIIGPPGTCFENGCFPARLTFPEDYPLSPPKMKFVCDLFHPNIYPDGNVCISILHSPGDDPTGYESSSERWSPVLSVEKVLISVVSMLAEPNDASPANVDAAKMWRENRAQFEKIGKDLAQKSLVHTTQRPTPCSSMNISNTRRPTTQAEAPKSERNPQEGRSTADCSEKNNFNLLFVVGSLVAVFFGVFMFFNVFKAYRVQSV